jgi:alpha-tubulin suppressor-like RCC1 family protein
VTPQVWSWGWNDRGTLGLGHRQPVSKPSPLPALAGVRIVQVCGLCGCDNTLRLLLGTSSSHVFSICLSVCKRFYHARGRAQVAVSGWHCLALSNTGTMYSWGGNEYFQCGINPEMRDVLLPAPCLPHLKVTRICMHTHTKLACKLQSYSSSTCYSTLE